MQLWSKVREISNISCKEWTSSTFSKYILPPFISTGNHTSSRLLMSSNKPSVPNLVHGQASQKPTPSSSHRRTHARPTNSRFWPKYGQKLAGNSPSVPLKLSLGPCESYQQGDGQMAIIILLETLYNNWPGFVLPEKAGRDWAVYRFQFSVEKIPPLPCRNTALPPRSLTTNKRMKTQFSMLMQPASLWHINTTTSKTVSFTYSGTLNSIINWLKYKGIES